MASTAPIPPPTTSEEAAPPKGTGWVTFAGIMLVLSGASFVMSGIWAFRFDGTDVHFVAFDDNLDVWGSFYLAIGVLLIVAGVSVFSRAQWARWVGVGAASIAIVFRAAWLQSPPLQWDAAIGIAIAVLVLYGLLVYGEE